MFAHPWLKLYSKMINNTCHTSACERFEIAFLSCNCLLSETEGSKKHDILFYHIQMDVVDAVVALTGKTVVVQLHLVNPA